MQMSFRSTLRLIIGNINETFLSKTGMWKKQVLQDPGYVEGVESAWGISGYVQGLGTYPTGMGPRGTGDTTGYG